MSVIMQVALSGTQQTIHTNTTRKTSRWHTGESDKNNNPNSRHTNTLFSCTLPITHTNSTPVYISILLSHTHTYQLTLEIRSTHPNPCQWKNLSDSNIQQCVHQLNNNKQQSSTLCDSVTDAGSPSLELFSRQITSYYITQTFLFPTIVEITLEKTTFLYTATVDCNAQHNTLSLVLCCLDTQSFCPTARKGQKPLPCYCKSLVSAVLVHQLSNFLSSEFFY